ncbi:D-2-hydroxyacid dehydrogenase [Methylobacterium persicinum]|uniref:Glycerate dehydrogenase n=1 Tax=Methylobacterium persicinum TaxID=374426 RepID=A0ABU0HI26_9HYPH|nr:D-2-hydroxyacid dehydrogenase [Methylobacterium persicinum]MDQ0441146.1 glycerate dehydrogenase [Methylobacterium persicinum]GJE40607.1 Glycerate dehydrogenase [Methylobacterium persicinum]
MAKRIVFLDRESLDAKLKPFSFAHDYAEYDSTWTPEDTVQRLKGAEIALINKVPMRAEVLKQLPDLKLIAVAATGTDVVDKAQAKAQGITVVNIRNYAFNTVPEHVVGLMFALRRAIVPYANSVKRGDWAKSSQFCYFDYPIYDIAGSTLGIVGYGALGKSIAKRAEALGMKVLAYDTFPQDGLSDFETVLTQSDVITLHVPLTPETKGLIGAAELKRMKKNAILINTARGGLVDEAALLEALKDGTIAGAGFDVVAQEPPRDGNILCEADLPNLIVTPHVAWASKEAMQILADQLVDNVEAFVAGKPQNVVEG